MSELQFTNQVAYSTTNSNIDRATTTFDDADTYTNLVFGSVSQIIIGDSGNAFNFNSFTTGSFRTTEVGTYLFQFQFTFAGDTDPYKIRVLQNNIDLVYPTIEFTTRGADTNWEVANSFLVKCDYTPLSDGGADGLLSSKNTFQFQAKNTVATDSLFLENGIYNIIKID